MENSNDIRGKAKGSEEHARGGHTLSSEELFSRATALHQGGDIAGAARLYLQISERYLGDPKAELAKTLLAGIQKEKVAVLWSAAANERAQCKPQEAVLLYRMIINDLPGSPEANSAQLELKGLAEIKQYWDTAMTAQVQGNDAKALELYRQIIDRHPNTPEAENASIMLAMLQQNQLMSRKETTQELKSKKGIRETIIESLLAHRAAMAGGGGTSSPEMEREELEMKKVEQVWVQADALEKDGHLKEALILFKRIIDTSRNGHRVRDAKYRAEQLRMRLSEQDPIVSAAQSWGLQQKDQGGFLQRFSGAKALIAACALIILVAAGVLVFWLTRPPSWTDIVENAKKSIVVVRSAGGPGTGFLISKDGIIVTNAHLIGADQTVDIRLYSGALKRARVVKVGMDVLDIAVLRIDGLYDEFLALSEQDECREGNELRVVGAPLGMEYFISKAIVSHCNLERDGVRYVQTDPAMNVGQSGGPGLDRTGKVIGLSTTIALGDDANSIHLLLPSTLVKDFMAGKLTSLEESLTRRKEERLRAEEESRKKLYAEIEKINQRLQSVLAVEREAYLRQLIDLIRQNRLTQQQGDLMVEQVKYGPSGALMADWVQALSIKVAEQRFTEDDAVRMIQKRYVVY